MKTLEKPRKVLKAPQKVATADEPQLSDHEQKGRETARLLLQSLAQGSKEAREEIEQLGIKPKF